MANLVPKIVLPEGEEERLVRRLEDMIAEAEEFHSNWSDLHDIYLRQYLCEPDSDEKTWPWSGASNIFLPLGRVIQDGILAQLHDAMFTNDPFMKLAPMEPSDSWTAEALSIWYGEIVFKQTIPLKLIGNDWNFNMSLDGTAAVKPRWDRDQYLRRRLRTEMTPIEKEFETEFLGVKMKSKEITGYEERYVEDVEIIRQQSPVLDVVDMDRFFIAPDTSFDLQYPNCAWYYQEQNLTWEALLERKRSGYDNIDAELYGKVGPRDTTAREATKLRDEEMSEGAVLETAKVCEFYMRLVLPADVTYVGPDGKKETRKQTGSTEDEDESDSGFPEEVIVTYLRDTKRIARITPLSRIHPSGRRPHIPNFYNRIPGRFYGQGIQAKMRHLNAWINSNTNQAVDFGTLQNLPFYFYEPAQTGLLPDMHGLTPGEGVPVMNARGINIPRFNGDYNFWLSNNQTARDWAERDGNYNDFTAGRAPSTPNAPRTARGQIALMQAGQVAFGRFASLMIPAYEEMMRSVHELHRRYATDEMIKATLGAARSPSFRQMRMSRRMFDTDLDFKFIINPNRQSEQQLAMQMFQLFSAIPFVAQNPMGVRALAKKVWDKTGQGSEMDFREIWPEVDPYAVQGGQQPGMMPGMEQGGGMGMPPGMQPPGPPQPGVTPPGPLDGLSADLGSIASPASDLSDLDVNVTVN